MTQVARPQGNVEVPEKKKAEDKGFFVQLPCYLIDEFQDKLTSTAFVAFLRFIRKYAKKGIANYKGSYRALARELNISHTSAIRVTDQWKQAELAEKKEDENSDMLTVSVSLAPIWLKNIEHSKELDACPNLGKVEQNVTPQQLVNGSVVTKNSTSVTNIDTAVTICDNLVTFCSTFERKNDPRYREITRLLDTFLGAHESEQDSPDPSSTEKEKISCSQKNEQPREETNGYSHFEIPQFYTGVPFAWLQENQETSKNTPSQVSVDVTQTTPPMVETTTLFPSEPKPARPNIGIGNLREGLNERGANKPLTKAQQRAIDAEEKRAEESRVKGREQDLWKMTERIAGVIVPTKYATDSISAMAKSKMPLEDIEIIMQKYADAGVFDLTKIANYLPTYAARKQRKQTQETGNITPFPNRYPTPQQEVRIVKPKDATHYGAHLNAANYDEEPIRATR